VELAGVNDPALVVQAIADVLDLREQQAVSLLELTIRHVGERHMLLLLDNCEHLVEACASAAQALLTGCPNLRILATSRQSLRIPGEVVFRVPSLPIPDPAAEMDPGELAPIDSVRLFTERAQAVVPTFSLTAENAVAIARLCHHLDGLPLAIELAASRVAVLPVTAIVDRLNDRFRLLVGGSRTALSRQQTLKATLDWSYNLLTDPQRRVLRALSTFVGGASLEAAEVVCSAPGVDHRDVLHLLGELVDQSLVTLDDAAEEPRYRLLETVREYAHDRLTEEKEREAAEDAHGTWALGLAERAEAAVPGPGWRRSLALMELDHDNLRAALRPQPLIRLEPCPSPRCQHVAVLAMARSPSRGPTVTRPGARPAAHADRAAGPRDARPRSTHHPFGRTAHWGPACARGLRDLPGAQ
jgi:predicted ATPase